jgi:hypothetical protein
VFYSPPLLFGEAIVVRWRPFFFHGLVFARSLLSVFEG